MSTPIADISAGTVLAGKYRVDRFLGQGGMGVVVEARHISLDDRVALKFLLPEYASHPEAAERFMREARAAVKVKGPHVARVSDVGTLENGAPYMVMEYLDGTDASKLIEHEQLSVPEAIDFLVQASDAISEAHSLGIVHRDLKPANLFVTRHKDGTPFIKVLDFGISKVIGDGAVESLTRTSATMGSALYMSPEQIRQSKSVDHRTDIYALGVTLYELLSGRQPFIAESFAALCVEIATGAPTPLAQVRPDIPLELAAAIEKAYARDPALRYQSVAEMVVALAPWALARSQPVIERIARSAGLVPGLVAPQAASPALGARASYTGSQARTDLTAGTTLPPVKRSIVLPVALAFVLLGLAGAGVFFVPRILRPAAEPPPTESAAAALEQPPAPPASTTPTSVEPAPVVEPTLEPVVEKPPATATPPKAPSLKAATQKLGGAVSKEQPKVPEKSAITAEAKPSAAPSAPVKPKNAYDQR